MRKIKEQKRQANNARKKLEGDISVSKKQEPKTKKGRELLEAMMVDRRLTQDRGKIQVAVIIYKGVQDFPTANQETQQWQSPWDNWRGEQNQWSFPPNVRLTARKKRIIFATVMKIAVLVLFKTHVY